MVSLFQIRLTICGIRDESKNGGEKREDENVNGEMREKK